MRALATIALRGTLLAALLSTAVGCSSDSKPDTIDGGEDSGATGDGGNNGDGGGNGDGGTDGGVTSLLERPPTSLPRPPTLSAVPDSLRPPAN